MDHLLYGAAYYDEYMPYDRCELDARMMKKAGMNVVRIAESTWATYETSDGVFDFSHVTRVLDVMEKYGIAVIVGTPAYAVPAWLVKKYPEILAVTPYGRARYGARQNMDITNKHYRFYAERIIRKLMEVTAGRKCVIGFQLDNETKYYDVAGLEVQAGFVKWLRVKFHDSLAEMNSAFGLDYWSNRINSWEEFPDVTGTINGSLAAEFDRYRRSLVTEFLAWQAEIVREYKRKDQFITHNLDFGWKEHSYGIQPGCDHREIAKHLTVAGCDIYHPSQSDLTGEEIAFGGDLIRTLKHDNYLILETQAQGYPRWTPYPGQLRLLAYSHIASGAKMVEYWHWHSIHNSFETYWKGVLSHDLGENRIYREASVIGNEWQRIGPHLAGLSKRNRIAVMVSNTALTALDKFRIDAVSGDSGTIGYNDVLRGVYDRLFHLNLECDLIWENEADPGAYDMIVVPAMYTICEETVLKMRAYVENGGVLLMTFKSAFADDNVKVWAGLHPYRLTDVFGTYYQEFAFPDRESSASVFAELLEVEEGTEILMRYDNPFWKEYAAVTAHPYGKGWGIYMGTMPYREKLDEILLYAAGKAGISVPERFTVCDSAAPDNAAEEECSYRRKEDEKDGKAGKTGMGTNGSAAGGIIPWEEDRSKHTVAIRRGTNRDGREIVFYLNYSAHSQTGLHRGEDSVSLFDGHAVPSGSVLTLEPWGVEVLEEMREKLG